LFKKRNEFDVDLDAQPSSTTTITHQTWSTMINSSYTKTVYESTERFHLQFRENYKSKNDLIIEYFRQIVNQLCGWSTVDSKSSGYDRMNSLLEQEQYEKLAAIYIFQMNVTKALEILNDGLQRGGKEEYATLILALVGSIRATSANTDDKTSLNDFSSITKLFHRPYIKAMFAFIFQQDSNDLLYECVLVSQNRKQQQQQQQQHCLCVFLG